MKDIIINDLYDRLSKMLKNDQHYSYKVVAERIAACIADIQQPEMYYVSYPALLDIAELGASLEYAVPGYEDQIVQQIRYKLRELKSQLPDLT
jgi:hypothetical protein